MLSKRLLISAFVTLITLSGCDSFAYNDYTTDVIDSYDTNSSIEEVLDSYDYKDTDYGNLSNDNYYVNVDGHEVHSPAYSDSVPEGASAKCRDGTYSFSLNRRGTCSHHGGVSQWL